MPAKKKGRKSTYVAPPKPVPPPHRVQYEADKTTIQTQVKSVTNRIETDQLNSHGFQVKICQRNWDFNYAIMHFSSMAKIHEMQIRIANHIHAGSISANDITVYTANGIANPFARILDLFPQIRDVKRELAQKNGLLNKEPTEQQQNNENSFSMQMWKNRPMINYAEPLVQLIDKPIPRYQQTSAPAIPIVTIYYDTLPYIQVNQHPSTAPFLVNINDNIKGSEYLKKEEKKEDAHIPKSRFRRLDRTCPLLMI
jgi:hypothetical protein